ncbi:MAG TPA: dihydrofolate reductase family protein [Streptosporangiaceae bacterium]
MPTTPTGSQVSKTASSVRLVTVSSGDSASRRAGLRLTQTAAHEVDELRRGGNGYIVSHGGISFWRSLAGLDLIDEYVVTLVSYLAGEGPRLFEDVGKSRSLELVSSTAFSNGLQLHYRRHR